MHNVIIPNSKWLKAVKGYKDDVVASIDGYRMNQNQKERMLLIRSHLDFVKMERDTIDAKLDELIIPYEHIIDLLCTFPSVERASAITILFEIGADMSQFGSSKRLCCWAGLTLGSNESAGKKKSVQITCAGIYLKPALMQCAHATVKSIDSLNYKSKYKHLLKKKNFHRLILVIGKCINISITYHQLLISSIRVANLTDVIIKHNQHLSANQLIHCQSALNILD